MACFYQNTCEGFPIWKEMLQNTLMKASQNEETSFASRQESTLSIIRPDHTDKQEENKEILSDADDSCSFETIIGQNEVNPHLAIWKKAPNFVRKGKNGDLGSILLAI